MAAQGTARLSRNVPPRPLNRFVLFGGSIHFRNRQLEEAQALIEMQEALERHLIAIAMYKEEYFSERHSHDAYGNLIGKEEEGVPLDYRPTYYVRNVLVKMRELGKLPVLPALGASDPPERVHFSVIREAFDSIEDDAIEQVGESGSRSSLYLSISLSRS